MNKQKTSRRKTERKINGPRTKLHKLMKDESQYAGPKHFYTPNRPFESRQRYPKEDAIVMELINKIDLKIIEKELIAATKQF